MTDSPVVEEWMVEGELRAGRAYILRVLRSRFDPTPTEDLAASLESVADRAVLDSLLDCALACATIDEFRATLGRTHVISPDSVTTSSSPVLGSAKPVTATYLTLLSLSAKLKYPLMDVVKIIGKEKMISSPMVQEWMEGGELRAERAYVSRVLRSRFDPTSTEDLAASLESVADRAVLDSLLDCALTCATIDEFRAALS